MYLNYISVKLFLKSQRNPDNLQPKNKNKKNQP